METKKIICKACRKGELLPSTEVRSYTPNGSTITVELLTSICSNCHTETVLPSQHKENLQRLAQRKKFYGDKLMGEEYLSFRKRYGLTQKQACRIFKKGAIAFSRYESEKSYPDATTSAVISAAIADPHVLKTFANLAGVDIPLWHERLNEKTLVISNQTGQHFAGVVKSSEKQHSRFRLIAARRHVVTLDENPLGEMEFQGTFA